MKVLRGVVLLFVIALFLAGPVANAQSASCPKAFKPADCTLVTTAGKNLNQLTSFVASYQIYYQLSGTAPTPTTFSLNGTAPFQVNQDATNLIEAMRTLSFQTTTLGSLNQNNLVYGLALAIRTIKGDTYAKGVAVAGSQGWTKYSLPTIFTALSTKILPSVGDISQPGAHMLGGLIDGDLATSLFNLEQIPGLVKVTRQGGPFIDNQPTTQITATFDAPTMFKYLLGDGHDTMEDISAVLQPHMTDIDLSDAPTAAGIKQSSLVVQWYYGNKDQLYHGFSFNGMFKFQGKAAAIVGGTAKTPVVLRANMTVRLSQIGKPVTVDSVSASDVVTDDTEGFISRWGLK